MNVLRRYTLLLLGMTMIPFAATPAVSSAEKSSRTVRVAMCQTLCVDGDREGNFARIEKALANAKKAGAEIACFPETAILGWVNPEAHERAYSIPGADTRRLAGLAKDHEIAICIGLAEKDGDRLFDSVVLIDRKGKTLLKHRKMNILTELMTPPYTPGEEIRAVQTPWGRIGLMICADTFKGENLKAMRDRRPDLVLVPYGWAAKPGAWPGHAESLVATVRNAAGAIGAPVVGTDLIGEITHGPWKGYTYGGQSVASDPQGKVLGRGKDRESDVIVVDVPVGWQNSKPNSP